MKARRGLRIKLFPIGELAGETPKEVEGKVNAFLVKLDEKGIPYWVEFRDNYVAVLFERTKPKRKGG